MTKIRLIACCWLSMFFTTVGTTALRFSTTGNWGYSIGVGYAPQASSIWTTSPGATATFAPGLVAGSYRIWFYVVKPAIPEYGEQNLKFVIRHAGQTHTQVIATRYALAPGHWEPLGVFTFAGGSNEDVSLIKSNFSSILRAVAMKFDRLDATQQVLDAKWVTDLVPYDPVRLASVGPMLTDVAGHWAAEAARTAVARGWMTVNGTLFAPEAAVSRAQFASSLSKVIGTPCYYPDGPLIPSKMVALAVAAAKLSKRNLSFAGGLTETIEDQAKRLQLITGPSDPAIQGLSATRAQAASILSRLDMAVMQSHAPSGWRLGFHDEFDAPSLDESRWSVYDNVVTEMSSSARFRTNLEQRAGVLRLTNKRERRLGRDWTAGMLESKVYRQQFGYVEARMKIAPTSGLNHGFWLRNKVALSDPRHFEIDVVEAKYPNYFGTTLHQQGVPMIQKLSWSDVDLSKGYHTYAIKWDDHSIVYYVDGLEVDRKDHMKAIDPAVIILSSTVMGWSGPITSSIDGSMMLVDWVRAYLMQPS